MGYPVVNEEKCVGCEECVDICPNDVFEMQNEKSVVVNPDECVDCESCIEACEEDAIELVE
ncbi:4Fe-4S cluster protein [Desulfonema limicola]|uniref:4Fe-4S cluster protein n=1 Tax=Desulfonema limicola TaxID=45656 RepID=A0A975B3P4_9BACT|nr:4Fe-4S binding protein [Desulfonema limicola]QTA78214.1 4Fe-4S cluster protein [Desulfonema limicola]